MFKSPKKCFHQNLLKCVDALFWMRSFGCGVSMRSFDALFSTRCFRRGVFDALFLTRCFRRVVFDAVFSQSKKIPKCRSWKKNLAWTDLDQVNFEKNLQCLNVQIEKIGVDWSRQSQKGPFQRQVSFEKVSPRLVTKVWSDKRCSRCYTLRGCVFADVQSREELKMLLQAGNQVKKCSAV